MTARPTRPVFIFCAILIAASLSPASETTPCDNPGAVIDIPTNASIGASASATLTWAAASGASTYDVYLGPSDPPPLYAANLATTGEPDDDQSLVVEGLADATTYYWYVVAHAECDSTLTNRTEIRSFTTSGSCQGVGGFSLTSPAANASGVSTLALFEWSAASGAASYDLYLGRTTNPALIVPGVTGTSIEIPRLLPATTYYWKVVARSACNPSSSTSSSVSSFMVTENCPAPAATSISFVPSSSVAVGQMYAITWIESDGIDAGGSYMVERSVNPSFSPVLDRQQTTATSASFVSSATGTLYHRVRAIAGCRNDRTSAWSAPSTVSIVDGKANVIFTKPPAPVITRLGDPLEDERRSFTIENIGPSAVQVAVSRREVDSFPFFQIFDPLGGSAAFFTLPPREPKNLDIRFSGPPNDAEGSYQGIITVTVIGQPVSVNPYAWINLKVGGGSSDPPSFLVNGLPSEYAFFPPKKGDDSDRPAITVDVLNSGNQPLQLAYEIGPELWLFAEDGWNDDSIPANSFQPVRLSTSRFFAPNNSALPRYTYFTVRNRDGASARLLVQDNTAFETGTGRPSLINSTERSFIAPYVTSQTLSGGTQKFTRLRMTNVGGEAVQTDLFYTSSGDDGFDGNILRATVLLPPNDVTNITDPLVQLFGLSRPASGHIEVRAAPEKVGLINVSSTIETRPVGGGSFQQTIPTLLRGEGAIVGSSHLLAGLERSTTSQPDLLLVETTGRDTASVTVTLRDSSGATRGSNTVLVPRYGQVSIADVIQTLGGGSSGTGFRIDLTVQSGGGAVTAIARSSISGDRGGSAEVSIPSGEVPAISTLSRSMEKRMRPVSRPNGSQQDSDSLRVLQNDGKVFFVPLVIGGMKPLTADAGTWRTELTLTNTGQETVSFSLSYSESGQTHSATRSLASGATETTANITSTLFGISSSQPSRGSLLIETSEGGRAFARIVADLSSGPISERAPVVSMYSEALGGSGSYKPLIVDGIEQSVDPSRGTRSNLILNELQGRSTSVLVRLYEAGNRVSPIAEKEVSIAAGGQVVLESLFDDLELNSSTRAKDRTNVQCVVTPLQSGGLIAAILQTIDNRTGETTLRLLEPAGGFPATGVQQITVEAPAATRKRPVRRP